MNTEDIIKLAKEYGFDEVNIIDTQTITPRQDIRDICKTDKCHSYGKNWGCPPHGELEADTEKLRAYKNGLILQCVGHSDKKIDWDMYKETGERLGKAIRQLTDRVKEEYPDCMALGAGGCRFCKECARPEPCRFPDKRIEALEGYGIFITQLCKDNNVTYYYGEGTIAYNAALLW